MFYGLAGALQKVSARHGGTEALYLVGFGAATVVVGVGYRVTISEAWGPPRALAFALLAGSLFAFGAGLISVALIRYDASISQLSPLYNTNVLVTVVIGLSLLGEIRELQSGQLIAGTALIVLGAWLVSSA
jgi:uncharacterized membrane protein YjjP (DUF1212 family)